MRVKFKTYFGLCLLASFVTATALAQKPELVVQTGHLSVVTAVAFTLDGKTLASGSFDRTIKLWDVETGKLLRTLTGGLALFSAVAFSPDGTVLASGTALEKGSINHTAKLWDVKTGTQLRTLAGHPGSVVSVAFSPDGKILASGSHDKMIKLWHVSTGDELRTLAGHSEAVNAVVFSPNGSLLASASADATIKLWDVATGKELRTFAMHRGQVKSVAFSPDGKLLASGGDDRTLKLWDLASDSAAGAFIGHTDAIFKVAFTRDGAKLASGSMSEIKLWETATGTAIRTVTTKALAASTMDFSGDGRSLAVGTLAKTIQLWDAATGKHTRTLTGPSYGVSSVAFSPDGQTLASTRLDMIKLWDLSAGRDVHTLTYPFGFSIYTATFSPDGKTLATGGGKLEAFLVALPESVKKTVGLTEEAVSIKLWDVVTGRVLHTLTGHVDAIVSLAYSPGGSLLASGSRDKTIKLWDAMTGREIRTLQGHSETVSTLAFSPDGQILASGSQDHTMKLWDAATGQEIRALAGNAHGINSVAFSPDRRTLASGSFDAVKLWDVESGTEVRTLTSHSSVINSVAFSRDGRTLAAAGFDTMIKFWDTGSGAELHTLVGHSDTVMSVAFNPSSTILASGSFDASIRFWDTGEGQEIASLIALDAKEWLVATPDGLFDGSPAAWNTILWRFEQNTFNVAPVEAFFNEFYYPGLLADVYAGRRPAAPRNMSQLDRRQPVVNLSLAGGAIARTVTVNIAVDEAPGDQTHAVGSGVRDLRLFRNGSLVQVWRGDMLHQKQGHAQVEATVPVIAGENRLTAYAFNHDNIKSADAILSVTGAESLQRAGTAYIVAVGVNEYANRGFNLKYAVPDAEAFAAGLQPGLSKLQAFNRVEIILLRNQRATKTNILRALERFAGREALVLDTDDPLSSMRPAQPEDVIVIYFAGHGKAEKDRFYLIPHDVGFQGPLTQLDAAVLSMILQHSISDLELEQAFEKIDARQLIMVIDACNSGQALEAQEKRRGPMNSKGLAQLAYEKGMYILTAAQGYQAALEAEKLGHGYLTYALVEEGLKKMAADTASKDGQLTIREWLDYATARVPQMQFETMQRERALRVAFVDGEEMVSEQANRSLQRPRVFYRREPEIKPLIVAAPPVAQLAQ